jgi:hypothetical protein
MHVYLTPQVLPKYIHLSPPLFFPTTSMELGTNTAGMVLTRYDNVTLSPLLLQRGLRIGPIQRNGAAPGVIHTGRFFS